MYQCQIWGLTKKNRHKQKKLNGMKDVSFFIISRKKIIRSVGKWMSVFSGKEKRTESVSQRWAVHCHNAAS